MPRFYFDLREGANFIRDDEGLECDSLEVAEREAATAAADIARERLLTRAARGVTVEVRNDHGERVLTVTASMEIHRRAPPPEPSDGEAPPPHPWSA